MLEAEIDNVRNRGYQAARYGSANAELMALMNNKTTAKDVRESIAGWQVSLNQLDSATARASAPSRLCMLGLRLAQIEGKPLATARLGDGATAGRTAMSTQPTVSMSPVKDPFGKVGEGGPNPTPTANPRIVPGNSSPDIGLGVAGAPVGGLSQQRIASCSDEIRRAQLESQSWTGDANAVAARLGQFQKDLFEGRCAGHPEAQAYVAGANKMLGYGGKASGGGGGSLPLLASGGSGESGSGSPDPGRSRKVHNPAADAKSCTQLKNFSTPSSPISNRGDMRFINNCPTAVEFFWCSDAECTRGSGNTWTIGVGGDWPVHGTNVRWGACRGRDSGGFDKDSQGTKYTCPNLKW